VMSSVLAGFTTARRKDSLWRPEKWLRRQKVVYKSGVASSSLQQKLRTSKQAFKK